MKKARFLFGEKWKINLFLLNNFQIFLASVLLLMVKLIVIERSVPFIGNGNLFRDALKTTSRFLKQIIIVRFTPR